MAIRVVVIDVYNTLVGAPDRTPYYEQVFVDLGVPRERIYPAVRDLIMCRQTDSLEQAGQIFLEHFSVDRAGHPQAIRKYMAESRRWSDTVVWLPGARELLYWLKYHTACWGVLMTNISSGGLESLNRRLNLESTAHRCWASCRQGRVKRPEDPECWQEIEGWYPGVAPNEFAMIGDKADDDLEVPKALGWQTFLAQPDGSSIPALRQYLAERVR